MKFINIENMIFNIDTIVSIRVDAECDGDNNWMCITVTYRPDSREPPINCDIRLWQTYSKQGAQTLMKDLIKKLNG